MSNPVLTEQQAEFIRRMKAEHQPQEQTMNQETKPEVKVDRRKFPIENRGINESIRKFYAKNRHATIAETVAATGATLSTIYNVRHALRKQHPRYFDVKKNGSKPNTPPKLTQTVTPSPTPDMVNHPAHYKSGGIETIDFIEAKKLNYNLGNVVKYITRADLKGNRKQDLQKAAWYLQREIENGEQA